MYGVSTGPIWTRPEPAERRPRFTREQIAAAAVKIADSEGFEAVTMRRVAAELGAGTMSLYHYVRTKDDLVALMDDVAMGELLVPEGELPADWREALAEIARRTRAMYERHPWAIRSLQAAQSGPHSIRHAEQTLAAVGSLGLDPIARFEITAMVDDYVLGFILRHGGSDLEGGVEDIPDELFEYMSSLLATGEYPYTAELAGGDMRAFARTFVAMASDPGRFERGLQRLLDGIAIALGEQPRAEGRPGS
jgi:AcrR family transcriptional regulator